MMTCKKCGANFEPWSQEVTNKFSKGHVPLCRDCWAAVYRGSMGTTGATSSWRNEAMSVRGRGSYVYFCGECKTETRESRLIRDRASRPRCPSCGSTQYGPKTSSGAADIDELKGLGASRKNLQPGQDAGGSFVKG